MKKSLIIISVLFMLFSCSSKDEQFCKCMKAGEELNAFSSSLKYKDIVSAEQVKKKMLNLRKALKKECKNYQKMSGDKMLKLKEACQ